MAVIAAIAPRRLGRHGVVLGGLALLLIASFLAAICIGPASIPLGEALRALLGDDVLAPQQAAIITEIRLPRALLAVLIGAILAIVGTLLQGLFRNPLADAALIGVSAGAAAAAAAVIVLGATGTLATIGLLPPAAFGGALGATLLVWRAGQRDGRVSILLMLLAGIAVNALLNAGIGVMTWLANDLQLRTLVFWTLGSLGSAGWLTVAGLAPVVLLLLAAMPLTARALNALMLGEGPAAHLGIAVEPTKRLVIAGVAIGTGAAVAAAGVIGFVGLVVPHALRLMIGADNRLLMPAAALGGAVLMLLADLVARTAVAPAELPIGLVTTALGAPVFLAILLRQRFT